MRKLLIAMAATAAGLTTLSTSSLAKDDWVCWMQPSGVTACAWVTDPYHVRDVPWKPHRHKDIRKCKHCAVDFTLSHGSIDDLSRKVDTSTMRRFHDATLYGEKYRGPYNH